MPNWSLIIRLLPYILAAGVVGGAVWWVGSLNARVDALRAENTALTMQLGGCTARLNNMTEDDKSDAQVDDMPDLLDIPDHWLFPKGGNGPR